MSRVDCCHRGAETKVLDSLSVAKEPPLGPTPRQRASTGPPPAPPMSGYPSRTNRFASFFRQVVAQRDCECNRLMKDTLGRCFTIPTRKAPEFAADIDHSMVRRIFGEIQQCYTASPWMAQIDFDGLLYIVQFPGKVDEARRVN